MKPPTKEQINEVKSLIKNCIDQLIINDSEIFDEADNISGNISDSDKEFDRKLHEITINHRLALYIENAIKNTDKYPKLKSYHVDIEFNRNGRKPNILSGLGIVRPDIIIHSREDETIDPQNYLVIEAKKKANTNHDRYKVYSFIIDEEFLYKFGLTISYGSDKENIIGNLWYFNGDDVVPEPINDPRA